jgi:regulator of protease activity HflC (stomatin/prohibitin superfamily)
MIIVTFSTCTDKKAKAEEQKRVKAEQAELAKQAKLEKAERERREKEEKKKSKDSFKKPGKVDWTAVPISASPSEYPVYGNDEPAPAVSYPTFSTDL